MVSILQAMESPPMGAGVDQALLQPNQEKLQDDSQGEGLIETEIRQPTIKVKQFKSLEILISALAIFPSNTKIMVILVLFLIPYFASLVYYEIKLQKLVSAMPNYLALLYAFFSSWHNYYAETNRKWEIIQVCLFYLILYPLLELFSMTMTIKVAAKIYAGERHGTIKEVIFCCNNSLKGPFITCLYVHLLSTLTLLGLFWIVSNHFIFSVMNHSVLSGILHLVLFIALLYKYLDWSAFWNMSMVISVLEDHSGIEALGMSAYYGKFDKRTGFHLMLVFFVYTTFLRLLSCILAELCDRILVTAIAVGFVCLGNLVIWVAFVRYFNDCKLQTMEKKVDDEEMGKALEACDVVNN